MNAESLAPSSQLKAQACRHACMHACMHTHDVHIVLSATSTTRRLQYIPSTTGGSDDVRVCVGLQELVDVLA